MCDILLAMPDATRNGTVVFGKNSDRPVDDCQVVDVSRGGAPPAGEAIRCSYVNIPEARQVYSTIGCRPYWCWGYETGMNEAGVVGGNTAIFTRDLWLSRAEKTPGLTGMDLLRLGLERGGTAEEALGVITKFLEAYGQWGSGVPGQSHDAGSYDNAFLLADRKEAWVLETSCRGWIAERISKGVRSLSNEPTIRGEWDRSSEELKQYAEARGWWDPRDNFDFALVFGDHEHYSRQVSHLRWKRSAHLLHRNAGTIDSVAMTRFLRDHYEDTFLEGPQFHSFLPDFHTLCMHDSPAGFTWGNTATSVVVELDPRSDDPPAFWVAYLPPCTSLYAAYFLDASIPECVTSVGTAGREVRPAPEAPLDTFCERSLWWRFRRLVDAVASNPIERQPMVRQHFGPLEKRRAERFETLLKESSGKRRAALEEFVHEQVAETDQALKRLEELWQLSKSPEENAAREEAS